MNETHRSGNWGISLIAPGEFRKSAAAHSRGAGAGPGGAGRGHAHVGPA